MARSSRETDVPARAEYNSRSLPKSTFSNPGQFSGSREPVHGSGTPHLRKCSPFPQGAPGPFCETVRTERSPGKDFRPVPKVSGQAVSAAPCPRGRHPRRPGEGPFFPPGEFAWIQESLRREGGENVGPEACPDLGYESGAEEHHAGKFVRGPLRTFFLQEGGFSGRKGQGGKDILSHFRKTHRLRNRRKSPSTTRWGEAPLRNISSRRRKGCTRVFPRRRDPSFKVGHGAPPRSLSTATAESSPPPRDRPAPSWRGHP